MGDKPTTDDTVTSVDMTDDLDEFENEFFGREAPEDEAKPEDVDENEDDHLATDDDDDEAPNEEDDDESDEDEPEPEPKEKPKRNRTQERIEKLVAEAREAERRAEALERRLVELEASKEGKKEEAPALRDQLPEDAPNPDAKGEDGEPVYPLGEFDPQYIRDLTKFTITQEQKALEEKREQEEVAAEIEAAKQEIQDNWVSRVEEVEKELPDLREKISGLTDAFGDLEPVYGEYLASTIMASEYGPHIMYYLSQNIGEAQKIVASGPAAATLALGRLEASFIKPKADESKRNKVKVSDAPAPPESRSRGAKGKFAVAPDTDDLDAFEREFFKR